MRSHSTPRSRPLPQLHRAEWYSWRNMNARCYGRARPDFAYYGGRGITVCDRWRESFAAFLADMGLRPTPQHSLDRIDNHGNYEPGNCHWATRTEQMRNTRGVRLLTHDGLTLTMSAWAERTGIKYGTIVSRLYHGWSIQRTLETLYDGRAEGYSHRVIVTPLCRAKH